MRPRRLFLSAEEHKKRNLKKRRRRALTSSFWFILMAGQSRKWMILVATIWIQAFTGTNFDFSAYSSDLKSILGISQVQLNYLAVASDLGKVFGWSSGLALMYFPLPVVLFMAAFMGFFGYGLQWLLLRNFISLPYFAVRNSFPIFLFFCSHWLIFSPFLVIKTVRETVKWITI